MDNLMNCRATCCSWRKAADSIFSSQLPLMLSLSPSEFQSSWVKPDDTTCLGSLSAPWSKDDSTVLTETWPQVIRPDITRVYSMQGWLMFNIFHYVSDKDQIFSELSFFNPFSRARFKLPKLFLFSGSPRCHQVRFAFNSAPPGSEEFLVVLLGKFCYQEREESIVKVEQIKQRLAFIKFKQGSWIESIETTEFFYDIAVHDDNKLYALSIKHRTSVVFVFTLGDNHSDDHVVERLFMLNTIRGISSRDTIFWSKKGGETYHLSDLSFKPDHQLAMDTSTGELLLVIHYLSASSSCSCYRSVRTEEFRVFKLDRSILRWCEVFDIGDRFLFWDYTRVSLVSATALRLSHHKFKGGNCIFFCHANTKMNPNIKEGPLNFPEHDIGVFFLADRTISHFPINSSLPFSFENIWFSPAP
ncbi:hypothetical protein HN51_068064 [Arachis hypogaea]